LFAAAIPQAIDAIWGDEPSQEACAIVIDRVLDFADEHPEAARLYAAPGPAPSALPDLQSRSEIDRCGDAERLLEELSP
jgi:hypothetical protein